MTTEDHSAKAMADMIVSCTSVGLQGAAGSLTRNEICENARKRSMSSSSCYSGAMYLSDHDIGEEDGSDDYPHFGEKKRRLTFEQVKALEKSFELRNKLDPERKMQLTKALGLHPRQISIWFQNRRARWKAKQLEKDFDALKHEYETLKRNYDALLQKNRQFKAEAQRLSRELENSDRSSKVGVSEIEPYQKPANSVPTKTTFPMELSVKSEISITCTEQPQHNYPTSKDQEGGCYSYMTEVASSAFNIDSPRTIESPQSPGVPQMAAASANRFSPAQVMEGSLEGELAAANDLKPPPPGLHEWHCLPKVEVDRSAEESWCNLLYSLEEQGSLMLSEYCRVPGE